MKKKKEKENVNEREPKIKKNTKIMKNTNNSSVKMHA